MPGWSDELPWIGQYVLDAKGNPVPATGLLEWGAWLESARPPGRADAVCLGRSFHGVSGIGSKFLFRARRRSPWITGPCCGRRWFLFVTRSKIRRW